MQDPTNAMSLERFHSTLPPLDPNKMYWHRQDVSIGDWVVSKRDRYGMHKWRVVAIGAAYWDAVHVLLEMPTNYEGKAGVYDKYWSYGTNECGKSVVRRTMLMTNVQWTQPPEEGEETMCHCKTSFCYCDNPVTYEVNVHSMTVEITKGKTIRISLDECSELASFLVTAKSKIKEAKLLTIKEQQDELAKQLSEVEAL
jgi:hypothetical protein